MSNIASIQTITDLKEYTNFFRLGDEYTEDGRQVMYGDGWMLASKCSRTCQGHYAAAEFHAIFDLITGVLEDFSINVNWQEAMPLNPRGC